VSGATAAVFLIPLLLVMSIATTGSDRLTAASEILSGRPGR
jgi:hypothetical protein